MTNLVEKALLIGFVIFSLILFFSVVMPFIDEVSKSIRSEQENLNKFIILQSEIENSILYIIENPNELNSKHINYPKNLNITIDYNYIKYFLLIYGELHVEVSTFEFSLFPIIYENLYPQKYLLNISSNSSIIIVEILI